MLIIDIAYSHVSGYSVVHNGGHNEGHKGGHSGDGHIEEDTEYSVHCDCNNVFNSVCGGDNKTYSCASQVNYSYLNF